MKRALLILSVFLIFSCEMANTEYKEVYKLYSDMENMTEAYKTETERIKVFYAENHEEAIILNENEIEAKYKKIMAEYRSLYEDFNLSLITREEYDVKKSENDSEYEIYKTYRLSAIRLNRIMKGERD